MQFALLIYESPDGNIRELRNVIERAVILARGGVLEFDLPISDSPPTRSNRAPADDSAMPDFLTEIEMQ